MTCWTSWATTWSADPTDSRQQVVDADQDGWAAGEDNDDTEALLVNESDDRCADGVTCLDIPNDKAMVSDALFRVGPEGSRTGAEPTMDWRDTANGGWMRVGRQNPNQPFKRKRAQPPPAPARTGVRSPGGSGFARTQKPSVKKPVTALLPRALTPNSFIQVKRWASIGPSKPSRLALSCSQEAGPVRTTSTAGWESAKR